MANRTPNDLTATPHWHENMFDAWLDAAREKAAAVCCEVQIHVRSDGRVLFYFVDVNGRSHTVRADLRPGGALPMPSEALADVDLEKELRCG